MLVVLVVALVGLSVPIEGADIEVKTPPSDCPDGNCPDKPFVPNPPYNPYWNYPWFFIPPPFFYPQIFPFNFFNPFYTPPYSPPVSYLDNRVRPVHQTPNPHQPPHQAPQQPPHHAPYQPFGFPSWNNPQSFLPTGSGVPIPTGENSPITASRFGEDGGPSGTLVTFGNKDKGGFGYSYSYSSNPNEQQKPK